MRFMWVLIISWFWSFPSFGNCECVYKVQGLKKNEVMAENTAKCFTHLKEYLLNNLDIDQVCKIKRVVSTSWSCGNKSQASSQFSCTKLEEDFATKAIDSVSGLSYFFSDNSHLEVSPLTGGCPPTHIGVLDNMAYDLNANKIKLNFKSKSDLEKALSAFVAGSVFDRSKEDWNFFFRLPNDNKGYGLFDKLFDDFGNDQGNTHGIELSISKGINDSYHLTMEYKSQLYTQRQPKGIKVKFEKAPVPGSRVPIEELEKEVLAYVQNSDGTFDQRFLEENIAKIIIDNKDSEDATYYKVGVGWQQINEEKLGNILFSTAKQQKEWHDLLGSMAPQYRYLGGHGVENGAIAEVAIGSENELFRGEDTRITSNIELGISGSTITSTANYVEARGSISFDYQNSKDSMAYRLGVGAQSKKYFKTSSPKTYADITFDMGKKSFFCGITVSKNFNVEGVEYLKYDDDNDLLSDFHCRKAF